MNTLPFQVVRCLLAAGEVNLLSQAITGWCDWVIHDDPSKAALSALQMKDGDLTKSQVVTLTFVEPADITVHFLLRNGCPEKMAEVTRVGVKMWEDVQGFWMTEEKAERRIE